MNKDNALNENIRKVLDIFELRFDIGSKPTSFEDDYKDEKLHVGIWMSDINDAGLSVESCWDILSILTTKIDDFEIIGKFKTGYKNEKYENLASKVDEPPPIFEVLLPKDFIVISKKIKDELFSINKTINRKIGNSYIKEIDVLEDKTKNKKITIYINIDYSDPKSFSRKKYWSKMYELAEAQEIHYDKGFLDYFNSNPNNPLYTKEGFKITKILKQTFSGITPEVRIELITQKAVSQRLKLNSA